MRKIILILLFLIIPPLFLTNCERETIGCGPVVARGMLRVGDNMYYYITILDENDKKKEIYVDSETWAKYYFSDFFCNE